jgi:hypothetical protein
MGQEDNTARDGPSDCNYSFMPQVLRLRAIALALRVLRLRAIALALHVLGLRAIALALHVLGLRAIALALRESTKDTKPFVICAFLWLRLGISNRVFLSYAS